MKGKRTPTELKAKIIEKKINTFASARDIAEELGVSERTASRVVGEELAKIGEESSAVAILIDRNNNLLSLADQRLEQMIKNGEENIKASELVAVRESAFKQNQLLQGKSTENQKLVIEWSI